MQTVVTSDHIFAPSSRTGQSPTEYTCTCQNCARCLHTRQSAFRKWLLALATSSHANDVQNIFDVPNNDEEEVQQLMSLGHRAATRGLQSLETAGAAESPHPFSDMNDGDDDGVSGGGTAATPLVNENR
ncbi:hypothetical protein K3495_g2491 [Podosphaera aphanis]|nr:hypothetical protein K3495_g2491 [Podosphaera aphanis]